MIRKSTLRFTILGLSLALHAISLLQYILRDNELYTFNWLPQFAFILVVSVLISVIQYVVRNPRIHALGFLVRLVLLVIAFLPTGVYIGLKQMFLFAFLVDVAYLLGFPVNIATGVLSYAVIALSTSASVHWTTESTKFEPADFLYVSLYSIIILLAVSFFRYFYDYVSRNQDRIDHLNKTINNLTDANTGFQHYITIAEEKSSEDERNRIIREIHDSIGYTLTTITMLSASILESQKEPLSNPLKELMENINSYAKNGLTDIRIALRILKVKKSDAETDLQQIDRMVNAFQKATNMEIDVDYGNAKHDYRDDISHLILRLIQEGMVNSLRHGMATRVGIRLFEDNHHLIVTITDNGKGFSELVLGIGLKGIRERVTQAHGDFTIKSTRDGVTLRASINLAETE